LFLPYTFFLEAIGVALATLVIPWLRSRLIGIKSLTQMGIDRESAQGRRSFHRLLYSPRAAADVCLHAAVCCLLSYTLWTITHS